MSDDDNKIEEEVFDALDENKDGVLSEEEAVQDSPVEEEAVEEEVKPKKAKKAKKKAKKDDDSKKGEDENVDPVVEKSKEVPENDEGPKLDAHREELRRIAKARRKGQVSSDVNRWRRRGRR